MAMTASPPLILASASPRRLDLLAQCGIVPARVIPADIDESILPREKPLAYVARIAAGKANKIAAEHPQAIVLAADTTVTCGQRILGKAENEDEARAFLKLLSARRHRVITAVSLRLPGGKQRDFTVGSIVKFQRLSTSDIEAYVASDEWRGKAGGYGIQGMAAAYVSFISGSYTNIVGLPLHETVKALTGAGYGRI